MTKKRTSLIATTKAVLRRGFRSSCVRVRLTQGSHVGRFSIIFVFLIFTVFAIDTCIFSSKATGAAQKDSKAHTNAEGTRFKQTVKITQAQVHGSEKASDAEITQSEDAGVTQRQAQERIVRAGQDFIDRAIEFVRDNRTQLAIGVGLMAILLATWIGLRLRRRMKHAKVPVERSRAFKHASAQLERGPETTVEVSAQEQPGLWAPPHPQEQEPERVITTKPPERQIEELQNEVGDIRESLKLVESTLLERIDQLGEKFTALTEHKINELYQTQHTELRQLNSRIQNVEARIGLLAESPEIPAFARLIATLYRENATLQQRAGEMEQELIAFFRRGVPQGGALDELFEQSNKMSKALQEIIDKLKQRSDGSAKKAMDSLFFVFDNLKQLTDELYDWRSQRAQQQVRLRFAIDVPTYETARQTIIDALATGLSDQIKKLQDPQTYFRYRLEQLATTGVMYVADVCDKELDPKREDRGLQACLKNLFDAAGIEEIAPKKNDVFRPAEHSVVQLVPGQSGQDRSQTVAQLLARGFRYKGSLVRKASVMLFR